MLISKIEYSKALLRFIHYGMSLNIMEGFIFGYCFIKVITSKILLSGASKPVRQVSNY